MCWECEEPFLVLFLSLFFFFLFPCLDYNCYILENGALNRSTQKAALAVGTCEKEPPPELRRSQQEGRGAAGSLTTLLGLSQPRNVTWRAEATTSGVPSPSRGLQWGPKPPTVEPRHGQCTLFHSEARGSLPLVAEVLTEQFVFHGPYLGHLIWTSFPRFRPL